jgi:ankyrin repeat domain-containing protein 50
MIGVVYMEAFEHLLKFIGILTRYARDKTSGTLIINVANLVNYLKHLTGPDSELQSIQDNLKQLEPTETLYAAVETLKISISTNDVLQKMVLDQNDQKVLSWLSSNTSQKNHSIARKKHEPTTGNWFLQSETLAQWSKATKSSLWLYGKPGSGKTILCSTIIDHIVDMCGSVNDAHCTYFYFDFQAKWKDEDMLRSIISQLCASKNVVLRELHHLYQQYRSGQQQPRKSSLLEIFPLLITSQTFVVLDALDECMESADRADLLETIEKMMEVSKHLNIVVTSRKERDIEKKLNTLFDYGVALEDNVVDIDISLHIREVLKNDTE